MDQETIKILQKVGSIAAQVRREGASKLAKPGTSFLEVMDYCEQRILNLGGQIAWAQMAVNDAAAHYCPAEDDSSASKEGDIIKIDIGVHQDGWLADNGMTVVVGKSEYNDLLKATQNALKAAIKLVRPGVQLWELGEAQASEAETLGYKTVRNLSGHTIEPYVVHAGISIPAYNNKDKTELQEGWQIAIEPFVTNGVGLIKEKGIPTVFMVEKERGVRSPYARNILQQVKAQKTLPFTLKWLTRKMGKGATALGLRELQQLDVVRSYPPLVEVSGGLVSQFEHSMIVKDKPIVYTRHEEDEW
ncbi:type II methionyl aminopeptidase [Candidatus Woesearchaeota archaeon]|nr:type II methionyl aminopeptidase [Candidatus Woesearchaeota archaeon]